MLTACQREAELPESTSAAKEVYLQYADRKDLTVALIGDYQGYNAVMLQAQDAEGWLRLCEEFDIGKSVDATALDSTKISSLKTLSFTTDTINFFGSLDSMQLPDSYREIFSSLLDSVLQGKTGHTLRDTAFSITRHEKWVNGQLVNESCDTITGNNARQWSHTKDRLLNTATEHGDCGYLIHGDSQSLALWLFFYSTKKELTQILNTITQ